MLTQLEERDRRLIELRYFRNMTQVKTAQELGMTVNNLVDLVQSNMENLIRP